MQDIAARKGSVGSGQVMGFVGHGKEEPEGVVDGWAGKGRRDVRRIVEIQKYSCRSVSHALRRAASTTRR